MIEFSEELENIEVNFVVCSRRADYATVKEKVEGKLSYEKILDFKFIRGSIERNQLLPFHNFIMFEDADNGSSDSIREEFEDDIDSDIGGEEKIVVMSFGDEIRKKVKLSD